MENKKKQENKKTKNTSQKKIESNRRNSLRSTGPKTKTGKRWSRTNAVTHGIFSSELKVGAEEMVEYEVLSSGINDQMSPDSPQQQIGCERYVIATWRWKLAVRFEMKTLKSALENELPENEAPSESAIPLRSDAQRTS